MKINRFFAASILLSAVGWMSAGAARASTVLYDSASIISGQGGGTEALDLGAPGTLTITVTNIPWLDVVADLTCFLSTSTGIVGKTMYAAGGETFSVGAGTYYANWFGDAHGLYNEGVVGIKIMWAQTASAVPLPATLVLLLSGLGMLFGWQNRGVPDLAH